MIILINICVVQVCLVVLSVYQQNCEAGIVQELLRTVIQGGSKCNEISNKSYIRDV